MWTRKNSLKYYLAGSVSLLTFIVYLSSLANRFVNWDDNEYIYENPFIRKIDMHFFKWAFSAFYSANWHPLTWVSHALDYAIWGLNPLGHHLSNNILHAANTFLVVLVVVRLIEIVCNRQCAAGIGQPSSGQVVEWSGNYSTTQQLNFSPSRLTIYDSRFILVAAATTGLLFGLHPVHVESVAWVSERKDVLCAFFFLLSILSYTKYATNIAQRAKGKGYWSNLFLPFTHRSMLYALCFFILALLSKPMAVTLPAVLLILDWFPLERMRKASREAFIEKVPLFALSLASSVIAIQAHNLAGSLTLSHTLPFSTRLLESVHSLVFYIWKLVLPINLSPYYFYSPDVSFFSVKYFLSIAAVIGTTLFCAYKSRKEKLWLAVWLSYVTLLLPVLGIIQTGEQAAADRYAYLSSIGPFLLIGLAAAWVDRNVIASKRGSLAIKATVVFIVLCTLFSLAYLTIKQAEVWKDGLTFWDYVIRKDPRVYLAYNNRGTMYEERGQNNKAIEDYNRAIALRPGYFRAYNNLGVVYNKLRLFDKAIKNFDVAIILDPNNDLLYVNRGIAYDETGKFEKALEDFNRAVLINPGAYTAYFNRGVAYERKSLFDEALQSYSRVIAINPDSVAAYNSRAYVYFRKGLFQEAIADYTRALAIDPDFKQAYCNRSVVYTRIGSTGRAAEDLRVCRTR